MAVTFMFLTRLATPPSAKLTSSGRIIRDSSDVSLKKDIEDLPVMSDIIKGFVIVNLSGRMRTWAPI